MRVEQILPLGDIEGARQLFTLVGMTWFDLATFPFVHAIFSILLFQKMLRQAVLIDMINTDRSAEKLRTKMRQPKQINGNIPRNIPNSEKRIGGIWRQQERENGWFPPKHGLTDKISAHTFVPQKLSTANTQLLTSSYFTNAKPLDFPVSSSRTRFMSST